MKSVCLLLLSGLLVSTAAAHSLYAEFSSDLSPGSNAEIWIAYGHNGSANTQLDFLPVARLISPNHDKTKLELAPYQSGLKGAVALKEPGTYILDLQMETTLFDPAWFGAAGSKNLVEKYGRVLMPAGSGQGFGWSSDTGLEIVPKTDPHSLQSGQEFKARALWNGKPISGSYNTVLTRSPQDVLVIQHAQTTEVEAISSDGEISFVTTRPGLWVLSFEATIDESGIWKAESDDSKGHYRKDDELQYDQIAPTAYLTFWVKK
jgi:cobalt/nickel transport protein